MNITLQQLQTLDAVISQGSIQAGADALHKTHPSVITALKKLEQEVGFALFDRSGYRTILTEEGREFHKSSRKIINLLGHFKEEANYIKEGESATLNIILGDVTPAALALPILRSFTEANPHTRLNLLFENISGPNERLLAGDVDVIVHYINKTDPRYDYKAFCKVPIIPVVAPGFLDIPITRGLRYSDLDEYTLCIIRDTGHSDSNDDYFVLPDSPHVTVGDQHTKKEIILQRMGWGHMPLFMIEEEMKNGQLISIEGEHIKGSSADIVIARLNGKRRGLMAERLWQAFTSPIP